MERAQSFHPFSLYRLPNEMWIAVFESLNHPSDLLNVVLTCKHFKALAIRVLYRDLYWMGPFLYAENTSFWNRVDSSMADVPTSLTVAVSLMTPNAFGRFEPGTALVDADGSWRIASNLVPLTIALHEYSNTCIDPKRLTFYASKSMYDSITRRISTFRMLRELIFHAAELPDSIYTTIKSLPHLRHLAIRYCVLPIVYSDPDLTLSELPITELTFWSNKGDSDSVRYVYALYLCTAKHLHTLRVDWNGVTARFFSLRNPEAPTISLSPNVNDLTLRFPQTKVWSTEDDDEATNSPHSNLSRFLSTLPGVKTFKVVNRRTQFDLPATVIPHLTTYAGPMVTVPSIVQQRPVDHLEITDVDKRTADHLFGLSFVAEVRPKLQSLSLLIREWDQEILFALISLFDDLRSIKIRYNFGYPTEQILLSLGAQFLYRFPRLHTFHLYQTPPSTSQTNTSASTSVVPAPDVGIVVIPTPDMYFQPVISTFYPFRGQTVFDGQGPGASDDENEVRELILPWRKHCPWLREVKFTEAHVWRRAFDGDLWCKRDVEVGNEGNGPMGSPARAGWRDFEA